MMKHIVLTLLAAVAVSSVSVAEGVAVRNPFWPIGYEGKREVISDGVRVHPKKQEEIKKAQEAQSAKSRMEAMAAAAEAAAKAKAAAEAKARIVTPEHWVEAYKSLSIGGRIRSRTADGKEVSCVMINGKAYGDGDLVSVTHGKNRFTWRVQRLTDGKSVRLERIGARHFGNAAKDKKNSEKGAGK